MLLASTSRILLPSFKVSPSLVGNFGTRRLFAAEKATSSQASTTSSSATPSGKELPKESSSSNVNVSQQEPEQSGKREVNQIERHQPRRNRGLFRRRDRDLDRGYPSLFGLSQWNPFRDFDRFNRSLMEDFIGPEINSSLQTFDWKPTADMVATKNGYLITAELPGVPKESIKVDVADDVITIRGEKTSETTRGKEGDEDYYQERSYGSFLRRFNLPEGVDSHSVKAQFKDGVLKLEIPKSEQQLKKTQEIKIE